MRTIDHNRVSPSALSVALLVCSGVWFLGLCAWYAHSNSKDGWSTTPVFCMLVLAVIPVICLIGGLALAREKSPRTWFDRLALWVAFVVVIPGGFFTLVALIFIRRLL